MSIFGVPYSPIVPSFTKWQSGTEFAHGEEQVQRAHDIVHLREHRVLAVDHRIRSGALLGKVHDGFGLESLRYEDSRKS